MRAGSPLVAALALAWLGGATVAEAKRAAPAPVAPVMSPRVKYSAPPFLVVPADDGSSRRQNGGFVMAEERASGRILWLVQLDPAPRDKDLEQDVQDVFVTALTLARGALLVDDERGRRFRLDLASLRVTKVR